MSQLNFAYEAAEPDVVVDPVDDEIVLINLDTGKYFRAQGATAVAWNAAVSGQVAGKTPAADNPKFAPFVSLLIEHGLIRPLPAPSTTAAAGERPIGELTLEVYSDLQDLLSLDPVHEVDSAAGWPASL